MNRIDKDYGLTDRFETIYTHGKCLVFAFAFNDIYRSGKFCQFYDKKCPVHIAVVINDEIYDAGGLVTPESINERYRADLTPVFMEQKEFDFFFGSIDLQDKGEIEAAKIFIGSVEFRYLLRSTMPMVVYEYFKSRSEE